MHWVFEHFSELVVSSLLVPAIVFIACFGCGECGLCVTSLVCNFDKTFFVICIVFLDFVLNVVGVSFEMVGSLPGCFFELDLSVEESHFIVSLVGLLGDDLVADVLLELGILLENCVFVLTR